MIKNKSLAVVTNITIWSLMKHKILINIQSILRVHMYIINKIALYFEKRSLEMPSKYILYNKMNNYKIVPDINII